MFLELIAAKYTGSKPKIIQCSHFLKLFSFTKEMTHFLCYHFYRLPVEPDHLSDHLVHQPASTMKIQSMLLNWVILSNCFSESRKRDKQSCMMFFSVYTRFHHGMCFLKRVDVKLELLLLYVHEAAVVWLLRQDKWGTYVPVINHGKKSAQGSHDVIPDLGYVENTTIFK